MVAKKRGNSVRRLGSPCCACYQGCLVIWQLVGSSNDKGRWIHEVPIPISCEPCGATEVRASCVSVKLAFRRGYVVGSIGR